MQNHDWMESLMRQRQHERLHEASVRQALKRSGVLTGGRVHVLTWFRKLTAHLLEWPAKRQRRLNRDLAISRTAQSD